jgi:hypothetical protein
VRFSRGAPIFRRQMNVENLARKIIRKMARTVVRMPAKWYFNRQFKAAFSDDYDAFWVVDIDNTIADSWRKQTPQYGTQFSSMSDRMMSIAPFESMQQLFQHIPPRTRVVFLTARQYIRYFVTKRWLEKHGFTQADSVLVLVERMRDKVPLLKDVLKNYFEKKAPPQYKAGSHENILKFFNIKTTNNPIANYPITYFDDLSYNHENGEVMYYNEVIEAVKKMPIKYIGYDELLALQSRTHF